MRVYVFKYAKEENGKVFCEDRWGNLDGQTEFPAFMRREALADHKGLFLVSEGWEEWDERLDGPRP